MNLLRNCFLELAAPLAGLCEDGVSTCIMFSLVEDELSRSSLLIFCFLKSMNFQCLCCASRGAVSSPDSNCWIKVATS